MRVPAEADGSVWQRFLQVRAGEAANPNPPEVGLRMARLWDAIRLSAGNGGQVVTLGSAVPIHPISGIGPAKIERYADDVLALVGT